MNQPRMAFDKQNEFFNDNDFSPIHDTSTSRKQAPLMAQVPNLDSE